MLCSLHGAQGAPQLGLISTSDEESSIKETFSDHDPINNSGLTAAPRLPQELSNELGCFQEKLHLSVDKSAVPNHMATRRFPIAMPD